MGAYIPLVSSELAGPLGVIHLPRLWHKLTLGTTGQLHEEWDLCGAGFDQMVLDGLGLDRDAAIAFVKEARPSYAQFEAWVEENAGDGCLDAEKVDALNAAIRGYNHADETRKAILDAAGIEDDGSILDAVNLNNLDDWTEFHQNVIAD